MFNSNREFKMPRQQCDRYSQNKNIHTNGNKENLLFNTEKEVNDTAFMSRNSFNKLNLKWDLNQIIHVINYSSPIIHVIIVHNF